MAETISGTLVSMHVRFCIGLGLFGNQAKHALVEGNEFDVLLLQQVLYLRRPWGRQLMLFFPKVNAKLRYRSGLMETLGNI